MTPSTDPADSDVRRLLRSRLPGRRADPEREQMVTALEALYEKIEEQLEGMMTAHLWTHGVPVVRVWQARDEHQVTFHASVDDG